MAETRSVRGGGIWDAADPVTPMAIRVAATLRLADHIAAGTRTTEALAEAVRADRDVLRRLLDHLVTAGVLSSARNAGYDLTDMGRYLCDGAPDGTRSVLDIEGAIGHAELSVVHLLHTVRTGEPTFPQHYGLPFWDDLSADDERAESPRSCPPVGCPLWNYVRLPERPSARAQGRGTGACTAGQPCTISRPRCSSSTLLRFPPG